MKGRLSLFWLPRLGILVCLVVSLLKWCRLVGYKEQQIELFSWSVIGWQSAALGTVVLLNAAICVYWLVRLWPSRGRWWVALLQAWLIVLLPLGIIEVFTRPVAQFQTRPSAQLIWELDPHYRQHNSYGMLYRQFPRQRQNAEEWRMLVLGDSSAWGYVLDMQEGGRFSDLIEKQLAASCPGRVIRAVNCAVPGYSTFQMRQAYVDKYAWVKPNVLVLATNSDWTTEGQPDKQRLAPRWQRPFLSSLYGMESYLCVRGFVLNYMQESGAIARVSGANAGARVSPNDSRDNLLAMAKLAQSTGGRTIVVNMPLNLPANGRAEVDYEPEAVLAYAQVIRKLPTGSELTTLDLDQAWTKHFGAKKSYYFLDSVHPTWQGHEAIAAAIMACMRNHGWLPQHR